MLRCAEASARAAGPCLPAEGVPSRPARSRSGAGAKGRRVPSAARAGGGAVHLRPVAAPLGHGRNGRVASAGALAADATDARSEARAGSGRRAPGRVSLAGLAGRGAFRLRLAALLLGRGRAAGLTAAPAADERSDRGRQGAAAGGGDARCLGSGERAGAVPGLRGRGGDGRRRWGCELGRRQDGGAAGRLTYAGGGVRGFGGGGSLRGRSARGTGALGCGFPGFW